jgi:hypothetical protein
MPQDITSLPALELMETATRDPDAIDNRYLQV